MEGARITAGEVARAYREMRDAPNYTAYKDRKRHYERLLKKARKQRNET